MEAFSSLEASCQMPWERAVFLHPQAYEMFSWLLQPLPGPHTQLQHHLGTLAAFTIQQVQKHQGRFHTSGPARDIVDAFLLKMAQVWKPGRGNVPLEMTDY